MEGRLVYHHTQSHDVAGKPPTQIAPHRRTRQEFFTFPHDQVVKYSDVHLVEGRCAEHRASLQFVEGQKENINSLTRAHALARREHFLRQRPDEVSIGNSRHCRRAGLARPAKLNKKLATKLKEVQATAPSHVANCSQTQWRSSSETDRRRCCILMVPFRTTASNLGQVSAPRCSQRQH